MTNAKVNILTIQIRPKIGDREANFEKVKTLIEQNADKKPAQKPAQKLDLIVMSEFFNTGISKPAFEKLAEEEATSATLEFFSKLAKQYNAYILCGAIIEKDVNKGYNTSWLLNRNGDIIAKYRKIHLFSYFGGTEGEYIEPGKEIVIIDTELGKIGLSICFDISYPLHYAELVKNGAEIILCPAAWCGPPDEPTQETAKNVWCSYNTTRAIDSAAYFISANMCEKVDSNLSCVGYSRITKFNGKTLACAGPTEGVAFAQIDLNELREYRKIAPQKWN